ncbi:MAG: hypothetical protein Q9182_003785 [Xanthomendoza sp. 2 TL-2023]
MVSITDPQPLHSIKATSAHIAFKAPSCSVVDAFFVAALKAGGRIHGEPAERDPGTGYYSAAVLDFDDNSIEVMHRGKETPNAHHHPEPNRVLSWQKEVAKSTVSQSPRSSSMSPRVVVTNITKPTVMVADRTTPAKAGSDLSSKTLIGTLLGAAAGAAMAYAMTKADEGSNNGLGNITSQVVEVANSHLAPSEMTGSQKSCPQSRCSSLSQQQPALTEYPHSQLSIATRSDRTSSSHRHPAHRLTITAAPSPLQQPSTLIDTFVPPSEVPRYRPQSISRSKTDGALPPPPPPPPPSSSSLSSRVSTRSKPSRAHSSSITKTITQADSVSSPHSRHSSVITEFKHPRDVPLPASHATSTVSSGLRRMMLEGQQQQPQYRGNDDDDHTDRGTVVLESVVAPSDSVSQVGSKRSKGRRRKGGSRSGGGSAGEGSVVSEKTVKADDVGRRKVGGGRSILSLPVGASRSRVSVHRSVVSFLPGM